MTRWFKPSPDSLLGRFRPTSYLLRTAIGQALWVAMLFVVPLQTRGFAWSWLVPTALSMAIYLYLHAQVYLGPMRRLTWYAGGMALLGFALWPLDSIAFGYLICAGTALSVSPSYRVWLAGVAVLAAASLPVALWLHAPLWIMLVVLAAGVLGGSSNFLYLRNLYKDAELRLSREESRRLAVLAERERIGRDLHDLLGHTMSLVALKSELARRLALADPPRAQREMDEVERVARHALAEVRAAVTGLRRSDLAAELVAARLMLESAGVDFDAALPQGVVLPTAMEPPLALVLREAVTNIHRHAGASRARVKFDIDGRCFRMTIADDGRGGLAAHGNGVSGMRERVRELGGAMEIGSPVGRGTVIAIEVPLGRLQEEAAPASAIAGSAA